MKTTNQILSDFWVLVNSNASISALSGGVYKRTRPTESVLEDCVLHLISGTSGKFIQDGALYVKIFYNDLLVNNTYYEDTANGTTKESLLYALSEILLKMPGYTFYVDSREIYTEKAELINQHYAILKINFKNLQ